MQVGHHARVEECMRLAVQCQQLVLRSFKHTQALALQEGGAAPNGSAADGVSGGGDGGDPREAAADDRGAAPRHAAPALAETGGSRMGIASVLMDAASVGLVT